MEKRTAKPGETEIRTWAQFVRVSQEVLSNVEADLKSAGYPTLSVYDALLELRRAGAKGLRPFQLQNHMLLAQYSMSRLIDRLSRAGYATRHPSEEDGRGLVISITSSGLKLLDRMWSVYRDAINERFAGHLNERDIRDLSRVLSKLVR